jgi:hypothetical protein
MSWLFLASQGITQPFMSGHAERGVSVTAGEASSAGYGREAVKMPVFMPWPQSSRMQYEKSKKKMFR